jgi:WD40 repeat protein
MRQLLHTHGNHIVMALSDRTFVLRTETSHVLELLADSTTKDEHAKQAQSAKEAQDKGKPLVKGVGITPAKEVLAVAITEDKTSSTIWCAVSRGSKTLSIYKLNADSFNEKSSLEPSIVHKTSKRVGCLCFANVPSQSHTENSDIQVVLGGDIVGDAHAYSLTDTKTRVMLGHTASILTGISVLGNRVLTCDRDEKIRISRFPEYFTIEGILLGHEAYITAIDTATTESSGMTNIVASCSGDSTVRLWNIETQEQLAQVSCRGLTTGDTHDPEILIPVDIALDAKGTALAVIFELKNQLDLYSIIKSEDGETSLKLLKRLECPSMTLGVAFFNNHIIVLTKDHFAVCYEMEPTPSECKLEATEALNALANDEGIVMPESLIEKDEFGNSKLEKINETRGPSNEDAPWKRVERVEIAKEREKRHKRRKLAKDREQQQQAKESAKS